MSLQLEQAASFREDLALRALWYVREAGTDVARRYQAAVDATLNLLAAQPDLGRKRHFQHPKLHGLRSLPVQRPFNKVLIFYRIDGDCLQAVRLIHGARDLPRRLLEPPESEGS
jgi:plasmid stabilization system protein ParE